MTMVMVTVLLSLDHTAHSRQIQQRMILIVMTTMLMFTLEQSKFALTAWMTIAMELRIIRLALVINQATLISIVLAPQQFVPRMHFVVIRNGMEFAQVKQVQNRHVHLAYADVMTMTLTVTPIVMVTVMTSMI